MRPPPLFILPHTTLVDRLLQRAMVHELLAIRLRELAKLVVEPTESDERTRRTVVREPTANAHGGLPTASMSTAPTISRRAARREC